jgi:hypothetical protein
MGICILRLTPELRSRGGLESGVSLTDTNNVRGDVMWQVDSGHVGFGLRRTGHWGASCTPTMGMFAYQLDHDGALVVVPRT